MEVSAITHQDGYVRFTRVDEAQKLAVDQRAKDLESQGTPVSTEAPNVTTSVTYSPSLYAQAAQYQLYSQAGVLTALAGVHGVPATSSTSPKEPDAIHAVGSVDGSTVDTTA